jgi:hypothetical protein
MTVLNEEKGILEHLHPLALETQGSIHGSTILWGPWVGKEPKATPKENQRKIKGKK